MKFRFLFLQYNSNQSAKNSPATGCKSYPVENVYNTHQKLQLVGNGGYVIACSNFPLEAHCGFTRPNIP